MDAYRRKHFPVCVLALFSLILLQTGFAFSAHEHKEKYYQEKWCSEHNGQAEVVLPDKTRADCITDTHAIEFDFGKKWADIFN
ncbi:MAG: hypothetical protein PHI97_00775 [Desulfobulbus sp.]|nr:hypothetical protein [Desulfobulbus sp.]